MENDITLIAYGYVFAWIVVALAFGNLVVRVLRSKPRRVRSRLQSEYAQERYRVHRFDN